MGARLSAWISIAPIAIIVVASVWLRLRTTLLFVAPTFPVALVSALWLLQPALLFQRATLFFTRATLLFRLPSLLLALTLVQPTLLFILIPLSL